MKGFVFPYFVLVISFVLTRPGKETAIKHSPNTCGMNLVFSYCLMNFKVSLYPVGQYTVLICV